MNKEQAIVLIQTVKKGLSRQQVETLIGNEVAKGAGLLTEEAATYIVLQNLGIAAPPDASGNESFRTRMERMRNEPEKSGNFLKANKAQVGDMVQITAIILEPSKEIDTNRGPVTIPARPQVTGVFKARGQKVFGEEVKFSLSKSNEKSLYALWEKPLDECVGLTLMVASIQKKNIGGNDAQWIEWPGLPE